MITIIDYGVGNLFSLSSSLNYLGLENKVSRDPEDLKKRITLFYRASARMEMRLRSCGDPAWRNRS